MVSGAATAMVQFTTQFLLLGIIGLLSETCSSLTLEVQAGDNVTIWCQHDLTFTSFIFWFKHTSDSVPLILGCKQFFMNAQPRQCYFFTESERIVMSVKGRNATLTITVVNVSDTGLYYCSTTEKMIFSNSTYLQVKEENKTLPTSDQAKGSVTSAVPFMSDVFFILTAVFGAVIVILLSVLIIIILKHRKTHRGDITDRPDDEKQEPDSVNYAALQFSKKKAKNTGRRSEVMDPHVVYSDIRQ